MHSALSGFDLRILPPRAEWHGTAAEYETTVGAIQQFRGAIYRQDGAIPADALDADGRHRSESDERSFHVSVWTKEGALAGCFRLRVHRPGSSVDDLCVAPALSRIDPAIRPNVRHAISSLMARAWDEGILFGEVGGWSVQTDFRRNRELLTMPLSAFTVYEHFGSAFVIAHATHRHSSARILKEIGGFSLGQDGSAFSPYLDDYYGCLMEFVCFDSRKPAERMAAAARSIRIPLPHVNGVVHSNGNGTNPG